MDIRIVKLTDWDTVKALAMATCGKDALGLPSDEWKRRIIRAGHSPLRGLIFHISMRDIPYYVSVHLVRHKIGVEHFVSTQRTDRTGVPREKLPQDALVRHDMLINAEALLNVSRKRLCKKADRSTQEVWERVREALRAVYEDILADACHPVCEDLGFCPEMYPCGRFPTPEENAKLKQPVQAPSTGAPAPTFYTLTENR